MDVINLADKLRSFSEAWSPRIVGDLNDMHVKVVKLRGEFVWHHHGVEHCPLALTDEVHVVLLEPKGTLNTGNVVNERTVAEPGRIRASDRATARAEDVRAPTAEHGRGAWGVGDHFWASHVKHDCAGAGRARRASNHPAR